MYVCMYVMYVYVCTCVCVCVCIYVCVCVCMYTDCKELNDLPLGSLTTLY
jgi:hypothetical protein